MAARKKPAPPAEPPCSNLVLTKTVRVADVLNHPDGGPLVTLERGMPIEHIAERYLAQLCERHFTRLPTDDNQEMNE